MEIQNNIIKYNLRNVLFVSGTACGGKTTLSKALAEKYGYYLYDMDKRYTYHRKIAEEKYQPNMCYHLTDFKEQYTRSTEEQANWNINSIKEQVEMVLVDLMTISQNQKVVADVLFSPAFTKDILEDNQIIFLTVNEKEIRKSYFNRPEKRDFYEYVKDQDDADMYFENIFKNLELTNRLEKEMMKKTGFLMVDRDPSCAKEEMLKVIEKHFGLID